MLEGANPPDADPGPEESEEAPPSARPNGMLSPPVLDEGGGCKSDEKDDEGVKMADDAAEE